MKIRRRARLDHFLSVQKLTRDRNSSRKRKERARRDARVAAVVKAEPEGPFTPAVASWLSRRLGKPVTKASRDEILAAVDGL